MRAAAWGYAAAWVLLALALVCDARNAAEAQELAVPHQEAKVGLHPRHARAPEEDMLEMKGGTSVTSLEGDTVASKKQTNGARGDAHSPSLASVPWCLPRHASALRRSD